MPLNIVENGVSYTIQKALGKEKARHHLESLGFVPGTAVEGADFLIQAGCDEIQGYLYYRPMPEPEFTSLLVA